jgi:UDP-hydrolysing UDP-N-acetyl-D-glucosamine 2-epimerase
VKIHYVSGSRADFGLMRDSLRMLAVDPRFSLSLVLVGQALISRYGNLEKEVEAAGLSVAGRIEASLSGGDNLEMALAFAVEVDGLSRLWAADRPDIVLLLGDRGEMLAAAIAAFHLEIPIAHLHGGERSGTLDEGFRHAISKLATWHFPATRLSMDRLIRMGEYPETIEVIGAPGLVEIASFVPPPANWLADRFGVAADRKAALVLFHPVVQESAQAYDQMEALLAALAENALFAIVLRPNSDAGGREIERCLDRWDKSGGRGVVVDHLIRHDYLSALATADLLIGNSSSGILESASLGTPCVNLGSRQADRERNANVIDCDDFAATAIGQAIARALDLAGPFGNIYGDGDADIRLRDALLGLPLGSRAPKKRNAY